MSIGLDHLWEGSGEQGASHKPLKPLWAIKLEDEREVIEWFSNTFSALEGPQRERMVQWHWWLDLYKGDHFPPPAPLPRSQDRAVRRDRHHPIAINHAFELTEQWVSRMTRFKPAVTIIPANDEHNDRISAKIAGLVVKYLDYRSGMDIILEKMARQVRVFGEIYLKITWDPDAGDIHPDAKRAKEEGKRIKIANSEADGEPLFVDTDIRVGEIDYEILQPWRVYLDPKSSYEKSEYCIIESIEDFDKITAEYPEKEIVFGEHFSRDHIVNNRPENNKVRVYEIYHKGTPLLDSGRYIKIVGDTVLENDINPYSHRGFPLARITDIDVPGELRALSYLKNVGPINLLIDKVTFLLSKAIATGSHLKWMVPKGAVNIINLANRATVAEYAGGVPPRLEMPRTTRPELFTFLETLEKKIEKISGIHGISRGEPPPGIRAGIALQFLEEQENQRANSAIVKHNMLIRQIWQMSLSIAGDRYDESDGRLVNILGKNNQFTIKALRNTNLSGPFDIRVQNSSALPQSKAGQIQATIDLRETFGPDVVPDAHVIDMIGIGQADKYITWAAVALQKAESENEDLLEGLEVSEPNKWEEHIAHWQTHMKVIQARSFENVPKPRQEAVFGHIKTHEYLMWLITTEITGKLMSNALQVLSGWPSFFTLPDPQREAGQAGQPGGQTPAGVAPTGAPAIPPLEAPIPFGEPAGAASPVPQGEAATLTKPPPVPTNGVGG